MNYVKVIIVTNIIPPYRIPLFNRLFKEKGLDLKVIALAETEANRKWRVEKEKIEFDYQVLRGFCRFIWRRDMPIHLTWGLLRVLNNHKPDVVITSGYDTPAYWEAFLYSKSRRTNFILWNGTTLLSTEKIRGLAGLIKRIIINGTDRYVTYGVKAAEYLEYIGAPRERIHVGVNTVDMEWYHKEWCVVRGRFTFESERSKYPPVMLLYVGQLVERKNVKRLLEALEKLHDQDIGIFIVGSGPQETELKDFCRRYKLQNVYFEGFKQQPDLPWYYAMADALVLPSVKEVWGLVVNEALATGLYVLCSNRAGAAYDLIKEGWNGRTFDPYNVDQLAELIHMTKEQIEEIRARRDAISEHACREFGIERSAKAFLDAIRAVTEERA
ncbi:MAG: glycosyltransferase family 4 protein [Firmicutes bacterium]|nr:glycosyltransferase family 4 protein [Bacillota bacterium]